MPIIDDLHEIVGPKIRKGGEADTWADRYNKVENFKLSIKKYVQGL